MISHLKLYFMCFFLVTGQTVTKGTKVARGYYADNGPPTTLSNTGKDISLSYQNFTAFDNVQFVNGNQLGRRVLLQVWKSMGGKGKSVDLRSPVIEQTVAGGLCRLMHIVRLYRA